MSVSLLCGCESYHPSNAPRETVTLRSNILTTVTTTETTRADTYSEYVSSLKEAGEDNGTRQERYTEEHVRMSADTRLGGITPDTAIQRQQTEIIQRETAITRIEVIVVTTVPQDTSEQEEDTTSTVVCEPEETETQQPQTMPKVENVMPETVVPEFPDFDIGDIPPVPSGAVKADTALTNP